MLSKEGACLTYEMASLHDPVLGFVDPRLATDPDENTLYKERLHALEAARQISADQIVAAGHVVAEWCAPNVAGRINPVA
jgi:hypothetical protein